jgi:hypothetical protein
MSKILTEENNAENWGRQKKIESLEKINFRRTSF